MSRCRSFLPDLMTVRAVMVRAAMEEKKIGVDIFFPPTLFPIPRIGTTLWITDFFWRGAGHMVSVHYLEEFDM